MPTESKEKIKILIENAQYVCLFIVLVGMFIGTMYAHGASMFVSIPLSFGLIFLMNYIIGILIALRKETRPTAASFNLGKAPWWGLYILVALPINYYTVHMFNVEFSELENTRKLAVEKRTFINNLEANAKDKIEKHFESQSLALYTDYLKIASGTDNATAIAARYGLTVQRVSSIHGNTPEELQDDTKTALNPQKDSILNRISTSMELDKDTINFIEAHNFKQKLAVDYLDRHLALIRDSFPLIASSYPTINWSIPDPSGIQKLLDKKSAIDSPSSSLTSNPILTLISLLLINGIILLPVFLSERRKAPPKSGRSNSVTTY
jgi:hypothetical protein